MKLKTSHIITRTLSGLALAATFALSASAHADQTQRVGNAYSPAGFDFTIFALEGIDSSNPTGMAGNSQVNLNFEMTPSIGVSYDQGNGQLKDFGIGLYSQDHSKAVESTGLLVQYNTLVSAASANLTVEDFDLNKDATGFKPEKVTPLISIYGANNALIGTATSAQIYATMVQEANTTGHGDQNTDIWDINLGKLLTNMHASGSQVSKVLLYADAANGEKSNSDPYLLRAVGKAQPVPEPFSMAGLAAGSLLLLRRRKKQA